MTATRIERDPLGEKAVPASALYGIQTLRAAENFPISGLKPASRLRGRRRVDQALGRAGAQAEPGDWKPGWPTRSCRPPTRSSAGQHRDQFIVDVYQAGAGTSHNMNCNEVLANRANEILGGERGTYQPVHPNDHVNMAQSTNDVIPTAMRLATLATLPATLVGARPPRRCLSSPKGERSTRSSSRGAPTCRMPRRSVWGRSSPPTVTRSRATAEAGAGRRLASGDEYRRARRSAPGSTPSRSIRADGRAAASRSPGWSCA